MCVPPHPTGEINETLETMYFSDIGQQEAQDGNARMKRSSEVSPLIALSGGEAVWGLQCGKRKHAEDIVVTNIRRQR